jgi:carboxylesterase
MADAVDHEAEPFLFPGDGARPGALLVHGFTGTPRELRFLGAELAAAGRSALGVRLAGHGAGALELDRTTWRDWLASAETGLRELAGTARAPHHVVGFSLGGALAILLARRHAALVRSLTLIATPLWLPFYFRWPLELLARSGLHLRLGAVRKIARGDIRDPVARRAHVATPAMPLAATLSLQRLLAEEVRPCLEGVAQPALVIHSRRDHVVSFACSEELARRLPRARHLALARSFHVVPLDLERERVAREVISFHTETEEGADARKR